MAETRSADVRVWDWGGLSPVAVGLLAGGSLAAGSLVLTVAFGWVDATPLERSFWSDPRGWFDAVLAGLFGWSLGGAVALVRGARRDLEALRPRLRGGVESPDVEHFPRNLMRRVLVAAVASGLFINLLPGNWPGGFPGYGFFLWATLRSMLVVWAVARTGLIASALSLRFSRLGHDLEIDDLLDLSALAPLGRHALRNVALWVGVSAFFALMLIAPFGRGVTVVSMAVSGALGLAAFLGPVRGAHRRLVEERDAALAHVRATLNARLAGKPAPEARWAGLSVADLLAWEQRVERARTWPFDASTLLRFCFYVAVGLGSWLGAALVERGLGAALE